MASRFDRTGLLRKLTWADFGTPKNVPKPGPGETATAAYTDARYKTHGYFFEPIVGTKPGRYRLRDDFRVTISLKSTSWVANWVFSGSQQSQNDLLKHEQGHYEVVALMARDMFIDVMQLKLKTYSTATAGVAEMNLILGKYNSAVIKKIQDKYDDATEHGLKPAEQTKWNQYFHSAFHTARTPLVTAPDGVSYKLRLLDVLKSAGVSI